MAEFRTLTEIVKKAKQNLSKGDWDYLTGAADTEASLRRNRAALESWVFKPRILNNVHNVETKAELLGVPLRIPVILPPIGSVQAFDSSGGSGVAEAASEFGVLQILSSACSPNFEDVAAAVAFLASADAAWITGHTLPVDGGLMTGARSEWQSDGLP